MVNILIHPRLRVFSVIDKDLRIFMNDSYTDSGLMINTYLAENEQEAVLFGAPPTAHIEAWLDAVVPYISGKDLSFVSFCDTGDAAVIEALSSRCDRLTVIGTFAALYAMEAVSYTHLTLPTMAVV